MATNQVKPPAGFYIVERPGQSTLLTNAAPSKRTTPTVTTSTKSPTPPKGFYIEDRPGQSTLLTNVPPANRQPAPPKGFYIEPTISGPTLLTNVKKSAVTARKEIQKSPYNSLLGGATASISSAKPSGPRLKSLQETKDDFDFMVQKFADRLFTHSTGLTPEQGIEGQRQLGNVMGRAPLVGMAASNPLTALGFELLNQLKNITNSTVKKQKYSASDQSLLAELIPDSVPKIIKIGASVAENLVDIALMGGATNLAKQGLLTDTMKTIGKKLSSMGYGEGKATINLDAIKKAVKGTSLEEEASRWLKAKMLKVESKGKITGPTAEAPKPPAGFVIETPQTPSTRLTTESAVAPQTATPIQVASPTPPEGFVVEQPKSTNDRVNKIETLQKIRDVQLAKGNHDAVARIQKRIDKAMVWTPEEIINHENIHNRAEPNTIEIPKFKNTKDAVNFGKANKDNPEIVSALKSKMDESLAKGNEIRALGDNVTDAQMQEMQNYGYEAQLYREAMDGASGKIKEVPGVKQLAEKLTASSAESGQLNAGIIPGVNEVADALKNSSAEVAQILNAPNINESAKLSSSAMRENLGKMVQNYDRAEVALKQTSAMFSKLSNDQVVDFMDKAENAQPQSDPLKEEAARILKELGKADLKDVQDLGTGKLEHFVENYFARMWKDPKAAANAFAKNASKRPLEGQKGFLKQRTYMTFKEGIDAGLEPITWNPVDWALMRHLETQKYVMAHRTINELKAEGIVKFVKIGAPRPDGFVKIDDKISTIYSRNQANELVLEGHYYAQEDAARIINNYLSPGLSDSYIFNLYKGAGNVLNQFQLGLSLFHLGFTSVDAAVSRFALGLNKLFAGNPLGAIKEMASFPLAPITNVLKGNKLYGAWFGKDSSPEMKMITDAMATAGGRARMDKFYATKFTDRLKDSFRQGHYLKGALQIPFGVIETAAKPIMEWIVPRQKLGVFFDLMKFEMEKNPEMTHQELRDTSQKIWDSVDNRMGQLVYDNLFWNKTVKDLAMASTRSVGWNLGTFREIGGGVLDTAKIIPDMIRGKKTKFTYRMSYIIALPIVTGIMGAVYQYLATGEGPHELKDLYFPRTGGIDKNGNPNRVSLPSYMKDIYHYAKHPVRTLTNKLAPQNAMIAQMLSNKDYYGTKIRNEDDPLVRQLLDELKYSAEQFIPFGVRNATKETYGQTPTTKALSFVGITPAPYDINMTPAEEKAYEINRNKIPVGARTKEQSQESQDLAHVRNQYLSSKNNAVLIKAVRDGKITSKDMKDIIKNKDLTPLQRSVKHFGVEEVFSLMSDATAKEYKILKNTFLEKYKNKMLDKNLKEDPKKLEKLTPAEIKRLRDLYKQVRQQSK